MNNFLGKATHDHLCKECGGALVSVATDYNASNQKCLVLAVCENGHRLEFSWRPGQPPPVEAIPLVSQVSVR